MNLKYIFLLFLLLLLAVFAAVYPRLNDLGRAEPAAEENSETVGGGSEEIPARPGYEFVGWASPVPDKSVWTRPVSSDFSGISGDSVTGYEVRYENAQSGASLSAPVFHHGLKPGSRVSADAIEIPGWIPEGETHQELQLSPKEEKNVVIFRYRPGNSAETFAEETPGVRGEYEILPGEAPDSYVIRFGPAE